MALNDIYRVTVGTYWGFQVGLNVTHWRVSIIVGAQPGDPIIAAAFDAGFAGVYKTLMHAQATYYGVRVQKIEPQPVLFPAVSANNSGIGTAGAAGLPSQNSGLVTFRTPYAGRSFRGRLYMPFPAEQDNVDATGRPTNGYITNLNALANFYRTPLVAQLAGNSVTLELGVRGRSIPSFIVVNAHVVRPFWATQRRRGDFGRPNVIPPF